MTTIFSIFILLISCDKEETSNANIIGKWYHASTDTKKSTGIGCELKDTTKLYTRDNTVYVYEFFADSNMITTLRQGGVSTSTTGQYKFENGQMTWIINGIATPAIKVTNVSAEGWRYEQQNYIWCPSKTAYTEYYNFKKY